MRNVWRSSKARPTASLIFIALARSRPIGFSITTRVVAAQSVCAQAFVDAGEQLPVAR